MQILFYKLIIILIIINLNYTISYSQQSKFNTFDRFGRVEWRGINYNEIKRENKSSLLDTLNITSTTEKQIEIEVDNEKEISYSSPKISKLGFNLPLKKYHITSKFGNRIHPVIGSVKFHAGIDLRACYEPVYSIQRGKVVFAGKGKNEGFYVVIQHSENSKSIYAHLSKIIVSEGQEIQKGDIIAISGNTGRSTAPHLHFAIKYKNKYINPMYLYRD